jgi:hypothetical protein
VTEELEVLRIVTERLDAAHVPYMVTGSFAANYYAVPRMTRDIDIVVELSPGDADRLCEILEPDFYVDRDAARVAIGEQGIFNVIHAERIVKVDLIVRKDSEYRRGELRRRRRVSSEGGAFFVAAPEDLILSKLDWARDTHSEIQMADVRNLLASVPDLDRDYLARWVERLGLDELYRAAVDERHPS